MNRSFFSTCISGLCTLCITFAFSTISHSQEYFQYFDGADTTWNSIFIDIDSSSAWQIGPPQKIIFNTAASQPNVIVTDTILGYPANDTSSFSFAINSEFSGWGIFALQWTQKLDFHYEHDGGYISYSVDEGENWSNAFDDPYVYNFYGYDEANTAYFPNDELMFTGTDTTWRDIWLCFEVPWMNEADSIYFRFNMLSDSTNTPSAPKEGWMIDNLMAHESITHTVGETVQTEYIKAYPTLTLGRVYIDTRKTYGYHIIEHLDLLDRNGRLVQAFGRRPIKTFIDIDRHPPGIYYLRVQTNLDSEVIPIILQR